MHSSPTRVFACLLLLTAACASGRPEGEGPAVFDRAEEGTVPKGWLAAETNGTGTPGVWALTMSREDPAVLELTLTKTVNKGATFNLCLYERFRAADVLVRVEVAPKAGEEDQGGGVVWRVKGTNDYYVARWNPLEANLRAYRVVKGKREMLSSAKVETGGAKTRRVLTVRSQGASHEVWLDGVKLLGFTDSALKEAGLTGLWTKADAATSFSGFTVSQVD